MHCDIPASDVLLLLDDDLRGRETMHFKHTSVRVHAAYMLGSGRLGVNAGFHTACRMHATCSQTSTECL